MKKNLLNKSFWKSLISFGIIMAFFVFAVGSFYILLLGLDYIEVEKLPDGRRKQTWDAWLSRVETTGKAVDGKWEGEVITENFAGDFMYERTKGYYVDGKKTGKFVTKEYNRQGEVIHTTTECYILDIKGDCWKSAYIAADNEPAIDILINKYPYFYRDLKANYFKESLIKSYVDSIESIIDANDYDVSGFDDYYDEAVDNLETGMYDSLWTMHDRLALLYGLEELKQSQFRMAVIDHHRNPENTTFTSIQAAYPNYLGEVNDEGVGNTDFEVFCDIFDSIMVTYSPLDPNDFFFPDSIDYRLYRTLDIIYSDDNNSTTENALLKSAALNSPEVIKTLKKSFDNNGEQYSIAVGPSDVAGVVGLIMEKYYNRADKVRMAAREAYFKKGGMIDLPATGTLSGDTISTSSINIKGNVLEDGGDEITARGIAWATFYNPAIDDNYKEAGAGLGEFTVNFEKLESGVTYYFRSFAKNSAGIAYGNCVSFKAGVTGIDRITGTEFILAIYPNLFSDKATLSFTLNQPSTLSLTITDIQGRVVQKRDLGFFPSGQNNYIINRNGLNSGLYIYRLKNEAGGFGTGKFLIRD